MGPSFDGGQRQKNARQALKGYRRTVDGDKYTVKVATGDGTRTIEGTFKVDATKKPKTLDVNATDCAGNEITLQGIYELTGDTQKICVGRSGEQRPADFTAPEGSGNTILVWKKAK